MILRTKHLMIMTGGPKHKFRVSFLMKRAHLATEKILNDFEFKMSEMLPIPSKLDLREFLGSLRLHSLSEVSKKSRAW
jgi:hypothetical protein